MKYFLMKTLLVPLCLMELARSLPVELMRLYFHKQGNAFKFSVNVGEDIIDKAQFFCRQHTFEESVELDVMQRTLQTLFNIYVAGSEHNIVLSLALPDHSGVDRYISRHLRSASDISIDPAVVCGEYASVCTKEFIVSTLRSTWLCISDVVNHAFFGSGFSLQMSGKRYYFSPQDLLSENHLLSTSDGYCRTGGPAQKAGCYANLIPAAAKYRQCMLRASDRRYTWNAERGGFSNGDLIYSKLPEIAKNPLVYITAGDTSELDHLIEHYRGIPVFVFEPNLGVAAGTAQRLQSHMDHLTIFTHGLYTHDSVCWQPTSSSADTSEVSSATATCFKGAGGDSLLRIPITHGDLGFDEANCYVATAPESDDSGLQHAGISCGEQRNASAALLDLHSSSNVFDVYMNCRGCEHKVLSSWVETGVINKIALLHFVSFQRGWTNDSVTAYCDMWQAIDRTHDSLWNEAWAWERWISKSQRWKYVMNAPMDLRSDDATRNVDEAAMINPNVDMPLPGPLSPGVQESRRSARRGVAVYAVFCHSKSSTLTDLDAPVSGVPSFLLTDNPWLGELAENMGWRYLPLAPLVPAEDHEISNMKCKLPRTQPHLFHPLDSFAYLVYVDLSKFRILHNMTVIKSYIDEMSSSKNVHICMTFFTFSLPMTVDDEFRVAMEQPRYSKDRDRYAAYIAEKRSLGLVGGKVLMGGFSIRNMDHPMTRVIGSSWYAEILRSGIEDQISLSFVYERYWQNIWLLLPRMLPYFFWF